VRDRSHPDGCPVDADEQVLRPCRRAANGRGCALPCGAGAAAGAVRRPGLRTGSSADVVVRLTSFADCRRRPGSKAQWTDHVCP
jgi:hypothetical protein